MKIFIVLATVAAVACPIYAEEAPAASLEIKKQDKRGALGLGYGGLGYPAAGLGLGAGHYPLAGVGYGHVGSPLLSHHGAYSGYSAHLPYAYSGVSSVHHAAPAYYGSGHGLRGLGYNGYNGLGYHGGLGYNHGLGLGLGGLGYNNYLHGGHYW